MSVTQEQIDAYFYQLLDLVDTDKDGIVGPKEAAELFRKSGLSDQLLGKVWAAACNNKPSMTKQEFFAALGFIALLQAGKIPNPADPEQAKGHFPRFQGIPEPKPITPSPASSTPNMVSPSPTSTTSTVNTAQSTTATQTQPHMAITPQLLEKYRTMFQTLDTDGSGFIPALVAREFFLKSQLSTMELAKIWDLSDISKDGKLDLKEFSIAYYLIQWRLSQRPIPDTLPESLLASVGLTTETPKVTNPSPTTTNTNTNPVGGQPAYLGTNPTTQPSSTTPHSASYSSLPSYVRTNPSLSVQPDSTPSLLDLSDNTTGSTLLGTESRGQSAQTTTPTSSYSSILDLNQPHTQTSAPLQTQPTPSYVMTNPTSTHTSMSDATSTPSGSSLDLSSLGAALPSQFYTTPNPDSMSTATTTPLISDLTNASRPPLARTSSLTNLPGAHSSTPMSIPAHLQTTPAPSTVTDFSWTVSVEQKATYTNYFRMADQAGTGYITGDVARTLFMRSKLPTSVLASIWELADADRDGRLTLEEFMIAMHLINGARSGHIVTSVPEQLKASVSTVHSKSDFTSPALSQFATTTPSLLQMQPQDDPQELERLKRLIADLLREKQNLVKALRQEQTKAQYLNQQISQQAERNESLRDQVQQLELEIERQKIKGSNIREQHSLATQKLERLMNQKHQIDAMLNQKREQYQAEQAHVQALQEQMEQNKRALANQQRDLQKLRQQVAELRRSKAQSQKLDASVLNNAFAAEQFTLNPTTTTSKQQAPVQESAPSFVDDFGTLAGSTRPATVPLFFTEDHPIHQIMTNEKDAFGKKVALPSQNAHSQSFASFTDSGELFSTSFVAEKSFNDSLSLDTNPWADSQGSNETSALETSQQPEELPPAEEDFAVPAIPVKDSPPLSITQTGPTSSSNPFAVSAAFDKNNDFGSADFFSSPNGAEMFAAPADTDNVAEKPKVETKASNPFSFGDDDFNAPSFSDDKKSSPSLNDLFAPIPASQLPSKSADEDDFFAPLSDAGQREGGMTFEALPSDSAGSSTFKPFDAPLFD